MGKLEKCKSAEASYGRSLLRPQPHRQARNHALRDSRIHSMGPTAATVRSGRTASGRDNTSPPRSGFGRHCKGPRVECKTCWTGTSTRSCILRIPWPAYLKAGRRRHARCDGRCLFDTCCGWAMRAVRWVLVIRGVPRSPPTPPPARGLRVVLGWLIQGRGKILQVVHARYSGGRRG